MEGNHLTSITTMAKLVLALGILLLLSCSSTDSHPVIQTLAGKVQGIKKQILDKEVWAYLGIPFAEPPVGNRRFRKPVAKTPWEGILDTSRYGFACHQVIDTSDPGFRGIEMWNPNVNLSENCLTLNVWVPAKEHNDSLPVMVWIYGGGFFAGCASLDVYNGEVLSTTENVIVVTLNYRVASFGFLAMGDSDDNAPGNMGLFDQNLALHWVKDNIARFGGNPDMMTLFGESSGSVSVNLHMLSPMSRGLFSRAVLQSGASVAPWAVITKEEALRRGLLLAERTGCYTPYGYEPDARKINEIIDCLRRVPPENITANEFVVEGTYIFPFVAVVDGEFLTETPTAALMRGAFEEMTVMVGTNTNEGSFFMVYYMPGFDKDTESLINRTQFYDHIAIAIPSMNNFGRDAIAFQYTDWLDPNNEVILRDNTEAYVGDYNIVCPTHEFGRYHASAHNKVYAYHFDQRAMNNEFAEWMGVMHGDEIAFVFGQPLRPDFGFSADDARLSTKMMRLWGNFARTGDPNINEDETADEVEWRLFNQSAQWVYLLKDTTVDSPKSYIWDRANYCAFWWKYVPYLNTQTANIDEAERQWKEEFYQWSTKYMVDWKAEFNHYMDKKETGCSSDNSQHVEYP
ncbi:cholinesterase-like [Diadema antillarum]|uniref:cholinesterase-like n=1 Tax=Diadema antillarum TaxID=105358 RepID=UPI003A841169